MIRIWEYSQTSEFIVAIVAAAFLFFCRLNLKLLCGVVEVIAGLSLLYLSVHTTAGGFSGKDFSSDFDALHFTVVTTTYLSAIFAMARGLDNIYAGRRALPRWRRTG
jgi:hypothetical protein